MTPATAKTEFSRAERLDTIGTTPRDVAIEATEAECAALATRFALVAIPRLVARFAIRRDGDAVVADGRVEADVIQPCSVTNEPVSVAIDETVRLRFVAEFAGEAEVDLPEDALDTMLIEYGAVDLGEAAAETMALALDPFLRGPGAEEALREAGVIAEDEMRPFSAFAGLKDRLAGK